MSDFTIRPFGDSAVLLTWKQVISLEINKRVRSAEAIIIQEFSNELIETVPTFAELAVYLKPKTDLKTFIENLRKTDFKTTDIAQIDSFLWQIPVCYSFKFGIDLAEMAKNKGMTSEEMIKKHTSTHFPVYFIGFLPGFLYLGGLPKELHYPRKDSPRLTVSAGSVAIGGEQTGIYPMESPGGWNIIGKTPVQLFDIELDKPTVIKSGDRVQFTAISEEEFNHIADIIEKGKYEMSKTLLL